MPAGGWSEQGTPPPTTAVSGLRRRGNPLRRLPRSAPSGPWRPYSTAPSRRRRCGESISAPWECWKAVRPLRRTVHHGLTADYRGLLVLHGLSECVMPMRWISSALARGWEVRPSNTTAGRLPWMWEDSGARQGRPPRCHFLIFGQRSETRSEIHIASLYRRRFLLSVGPHPCRFLRWTVARAAARGGAAPALWRK